jgi:muramoyltetrapeptide carboxypeptidase
MNILKFSPLVSGDIIAIAAPSSPFEKESLYRGISVLEEMGFRVMIPDGLFERDGYLAGDDRHRAEILHQLFADRRVKAIICARGGFGAMRILSLLDTEMIRNNPKIFIGYSDITALLSVLYSQCSLTVFHGQMMEKLADSDPKTKESLRMALCSEKLPAIKAENGLLIKGGIAHGKVIGGNLSVLCHLLGTRFIPDFTGAILFLEDTGEAPYRIDRMLTQMKLAGCFQNIAGLVLGHFEDCGKSEDIVKIINDIFQENNIPILWGLEAGHGLPNLTIPMGIDAVLDADGLTLNYENC